MITNIKKSEAINIKVTTEMIDCVYEFYHLEYGYKAQFEHLTSGNSVLLNDNYTYTLTDYLISLTNSLYSDISNFCSHYEDEQIITSDIIRMMLKDVIKKGVSVRVAQCYFSGIYFDKLTCDCISIEEDENTEKYALRSAFLEFENQYIQTGRIYAYTLITNCIEAIVGEDHETELVPMWVTMYNYRDNVYAYRGLLSNDLMLYSGIVYDLEDCVYCEDSENNIPLDYAIYCEDNDMYYEYERSLLNVNGLRDYHHSDISNKSNGAPYKIGFEVEKEDSDYSNFKYIRSLGWDAERDGSLGSDGFELISPIYDLNDMSAFNKDAQGMADILSANSSHRCGGHINVSIEGKNAKQIFALIQGYTPLLYAMFPTRINNNYCEAKKLENISDCNRYEAINLSKESILEFRIFSRVKNANQLQWRYKFMQFMFNNQRKGSASIVRMLLTDSPLKAMLLEVYSLDSYNTLVDRVVTYTDIYMSSRDAKTTATLIRKMKDGGTKLSQLLNNK